MSLFEGALLLNLALTVYTTYRIGKLEGDIDTLYEGLAATMVHTGMDEK